MVVRHSVAYSLDPVAAHQLVERAFAHYRDRYPAYQPTLSWPEPTLAELRLQVRGLDLSARLRLRPGQAELEADLPLLFRPFHAAARRAIDREVAHWLTSPPV